MTNSDLSRLFQSLRGSASNTGPETWECESLANVRGVRIGCNRDGHAAFFLKRPPSERYTIPTGFNVGQVSFQPRKNFTLSTKDNQSSTNEFISLQCTSDDERVIHFFLKVVNELLLVSSNFTNKNPNQRLFDDIDTLKEIFEIRSGGSSSVETIRGLWGELFVIAKCSDTARALKVWHTSPNDKIDFRLGNENLEVKTTTKPSRPHEFSEDQVTLLTYLISIQIQTDSSMKGLTIRNLLDEIKTKTFQTHPELWKKAWRLSLLTVGDPDKPVVANRPYSVFGQDGLWRIYPQDAIPKITEKDDGVTGVKYTAELSGQQDVSAGELIESGGFLASLAEGIIKTT